MVKETVSKAEMMREAFAALTLDADLDTITEWIKNRHGVTIDRNHLTQFRSNERRRQKTSSTPKRKVGESARLPTPTLPTMTPVPSEIVFGVDEISQVLNLSQALLNARDKMGDDGVRAIIKKTLG